MRARTWILTVGAAALVGACGSPDGTTGSANQDGSTTGSPSAAVTDEPAPPASSPTSSSAPSVAPTPSAIALPGEPFGRAQTGRSYDVVGVAHDDRLNVRAGPGTEFPIVGTIAPDGAVVATGRDRMVDSGLWIEVRMPDVSGWVNYRYLGLTAGTADVTAEVVRANGGVIPSAATMSALVDRVARLRASEDPPSRITVLRPPSRGDLGEATVDVIGLGDDSVKGERLVIFAQRVEGTWSLKSVEGTLVCDRGSDGELCA